MNSQDEKLLDEYLESGSPLSRLYEQSKTDDCPPDLEARILDESRKAVKREPRSFPWSWRVPVLVPVAVAATIAAGIGVVTFVRGPQDGDQPELTFRGAQPSAPQEFATPEEWIDHIRELRQQGRDEEAEASLRRLKEKFPDSAPDSL